MAAPLVSDALWSLFSPLLPSRPPRPKGGRPPVEDRDALTGILFVLKSGIPWEMLPQEMGCGSGMTCWRRLRDWQEAGIWRAFHHLLLDRLRPAGLIDWSRCSLDAAGLPAQGGGAAARPHPTRQGRRGRDRAEPDRPQQAGQQAPPRRGPARHPLGGPAHGRQRPRQCRPGGGTRRRAAGPPTPWPAPATSEEAARRQSLRLSPLPSRLPQARHRPPDPPTGDREQRTPGAAPLGGRTHPGLDRPLPPLGRPLRAPRRHPPRLPGPRLRRDLLQIRPEVLLGGLSTIYISRDAFQEEPL